MDFFVVCRSHEIHLETVQRFIRIVYRSLCAVRAFFAEVVRFYGEFVACS